VQQLETAMTIQKRLLVLLMLFGLGVAPIEGRADVTEPMDLHLAMSMAGVTAGSLKLSIDPSGEQIESSLRMKSSGLFKLLTGYKSRAEAKSVLGENGQAPMPMSYDSTYETRKTERKVLIRYDESSGEITDLRSWKRGKLRRNKIQDELRLATIDPLTAVLQLRHWVLEGQDAKDTSRSFDIFDGRRRYRLEADLLDRRNIRLGDEERPALRFRVQMFPMAGFSKKDLLANWASEGGENWIEMIVTDGANPLPVSLTTVGGSLETTVYLRKVCMGDAGCKKVSR
jgi:hypothetical protein